MAMTQCSSKEQSLPPVGLPGSESAITTVVEPVRRLQPVYALLAELGCEILSGSETFSHGEYSVV